MIKIILKEIIYNVLQTTCSELRGWNKEEVRGFPAPVGRGIRYSVFLGMDEEETAKLKHHFQKFFMEPSII